MDLLNRQAETYDEAYGGNCSVPLDWRQQDKYHDPQCQGQERKEKTMVLMTEKGWFSEDKKDRLEAPRN